MAGPSDSKTLCGQMASIQVVFGSTYHKMQLRTSMPSLIRQSCGDSLPAVSQGGQVGAIYRSPEHPWTPDRSMNEASVKVDY